LIVDDDDEVREMIRAILEAEGYRTLGATNGREALHVLRRTKDLPDLILCDLVMPIADGDDLVASLAPYDHLRSIPFVFMTGDAGVAKARPEKLHAPALLPKPLDTDVLLGIVRQHCHRQGSANQKGFSGVWQRLMGGSAPRSGSLVSRGPRR
jgi:CheY-like chemotaxis protein